MDKIYIDGLEIVKKELKRLVKKYDDKIEKEKSKDKYITIQGEKCYNEDDIMDMYEADLFDSKMCDKYLDKLDKLLNKDIHGKTKYEYARDTLNNLYSGILTELYEEKQSGKENE